MAVKKPPTEWLPNGCVTPPDDEKLRESYPQLYQSLVYTGDDDEAEPVAGEVVVQVVNGAYKATLKLHALWRQKSVTCLRWDEILPALDLALTDPKVPWERFQSYRQRKDPDKRKRK